MYKIVLFRVMIVLSTLGQGDADCLSDCRLAAAYDYHTTMEGREECRIDAHQSPTFASHALVRRLLHLHLLAA